jgi:Lar family restriction alleviation protein
MHCPFCGEDEMISPKVKPDGRSYVRWVQCGTCDMRGPPATSTDAQVATQTAINSWNNRMTHHDDLALRTAFALTQAPA